MIFYGGFDGRDGIGFFRLQHLCRLHIEKYRRSGTASTKRFNARHQSLHSDLGPFLIKHSIRYPQITAVL